MAFISSTKSSSGKEDVNTASIPIASTNVSPASVNIGAKKTRKKISIQGTDVARFDMSKMECFNCHRMGHFARECRAPRCKDRGMRDNYRQGSKVEEQAPKALMAIDGVGWDWSFMANEEEDHALVADEEAPTEFAPMAKTSAESEVCHTLKVDCSSSASENGESTGGILSKPEIKFVRPADSPTVVKTNKKETARKYTVKYAELYRKSSKRKWVDHRRSWAKNNNTHNSMSPRPAIHRPYRPPMRPGNSQNHIDDKGYWDSGCSRHMTSNISYLSNYEPFDEGYVSFGQGGWKITVKGIIKTGKLEFENVYFVKDLKYDLFSVSQICDNKNSVLFTDSECIVLGRDFKLTDDTNVLLRIPRQHNMYSIDLNNIVPHKDLTCLVAKAFADECMLWHRRQGKQHKASCKTKLVNSVTKPFHTLHMDLFGPTSVSSLNHKWYCLVVTDDFSRFSWTFFLQTKIETSSILRNFIIDIENLKELRVKIIRCDNRGEFRNKEMNDFCSRKGIKREFSNARTSQQNGVAKRRNKTLIEAARTMFADAKLPVTFWAEAVNTACYVQNRVLVNKSQNKTLYELFNGRTPAIGFLKPFGCHV
nr:hypothetical protein [Tanacetum cinerariifolium]